MKFYKAIILKFLSVLFLSTLLQTHSIAEEAKINAVVDQLEIITQDLKTIEKAVYKKSEITSST